ncbi:uncharacterized protein [Miscanthus floridulus]|uniref:uncharacterized protein isoform X2 n=1 Tax=Miscanthus floridulus TaxID=154761 RepID=UPI00345A319F
MNHVCSYKGGEPSDINIDVDPRDELAKEWGWEMLLPFKCDPEWSDYCNYLGQYFKRHHNVIAEVTGISLVDAAETCLKKEGELVSLWDRRMKECTDEILPITTFILSSLIQEFADKVKRTGERLSDVSTAALLCISKEADLICELLKHGAEPTDGFIQQSSMIRMCALSLMHLQGSRAIDAAAAMVGITKECKLMCDWIKKEDKLITFSFFTRHEPLECCLICARTLDVMLSILKESSFPSSKMWLDLVANN